MLWGLLAFLVSPAVAQPASTSPKPDSVSVTIYRAPERDAATPLDRNWLNGYALISETRHVSIPAGEGAIRFEGVAAGIIPESAIVTGLPDSVIEKNQDALLLSPASLLARSLGRRVHIRRTSAETGEVREHEAVIRSGPEGAVVLQTPDGFEALRCTGLNETIVYPSVPDGLAAKPTLSVRTRSARAASATVTLSYLATGFDWQANYIATLAPSGDRMDLFAWVTLANGDETSFVDASTQTVAGAVKREAYEPGVRPQREGVNLQCWPSARTNDVAMYRRPGPPPPPSAPPPPPAPVMAVSSESIVVTGARVRRAELEELGDLKLYRIPDRVTVASNSQKQVALLEKESVKVETLYRQRLYALGEQSGPAMRVLKTRNRASEGLGLPLPAGRVVLFGSGSARPILLGEGFVADKAVGEDVEIEVSQASGVRFSLVAIAGATESVRTFELTVSNDQPRPITFEAELAADGWKIETPARLGSRNGEPLWRTTVPANGSATLRYQARQP